MSGFPKRNQATASTSVSAGTTSTAVAGLNDNRQEITITNDGANVVYLGFATTSNGTATAVANKGIRLNASGGSWTTTTYTGPIAAIAVTSASNLTVAEF